MKSKGARLKELISADEILVMPGVFDGFSARVAQAAGYETALITGAGLSESRIGRPDVGIMGLADNLDGVRMLAFTSDLLLVADGDTGYGNAINVHYAVREFERAGVAGLMLEDQVWPKRCGHMAGKEVIDRDEMAAKIHAAVDAREDPAFVIKARTDAAGPLGIKEAIYRANLYADAGADLLFADALLSVADIETLVKSVERPVAVNMGFGIRRRSTTPLISAKQLENIGVAVVEYPRLLTAAAIKGMTEALGVLSRSVAEGEVIERPDLLVSFEELNELMGFEEIRELEQRYLTDEQLKAKYHNETGSRA